MDGTNIDPYLLPNPLPIPGVSKSLLPGGRRIRKKHIFDD